MNVIHQITREKRGDHMTVLIDEEKKLNKIQHSFMIKTPSKLGIGRNLPNWIKNIHKKPHSAVELTTVGKLRA